MDVHCTTCNEPWDTHHLWHDAIYETDLAEEDIALWRTLPPKYRLSPRYRTAFKAAGFEFGRGVITVIRCPACPKGAEPDAEKLATKAALEELLGDDEDGLAATYEDYRL